jgi:hypothetical protein
LDFLNKQFSVHPYYLMPEDSKGDLFPTISASASDQAVQANFGNDLVANPFQFDFVHILI